MKLEDVKIGMKVKLLGKHGCGDNYDNIEDWFDVLEGEYDAQQIKKQGYGVVTFIDSGNEIEINDWWYFTHSDLEPYEEANDNTISDFINNEDTGDLITHENKTPKEWLLTPKAIFITRDSDEEYVVLGNNTAIGVNSGCMWDDDLENDYTDDLTWYDDFPDNDIIKITYDGNVVWERKEYMTLTDAIKTGKKLKHKTWCDFYEVKNVLSIVNDTPKEEIIEAFTVVEWEVE